ncbi:MAG TPA: phosphate signaling complex protein PhoU [Candidatus Acidoferrales bacterium]|nr:phosphate signaling complex protein PhoU [Candidatus Acidoferrales bacterium]
MSRLIDRGLEEQSALLAKMGELTYQTLALSINGYLDGRSVTEQVREMSEVLVAMGAAVEDKTFELIVRFQPVASDLRAIKSYMKIGNDFARYGRYALDISSLSEQLGGLKQSEPWSKEYLSEMSEKVLSMVRTSVDSLRKHDVALARTITPTEREVDKMHLEYVNKIISQPNANSRVVASSIMVTRYLERIADHAVYVCESIIYIVTGEKTNLG